MASGGILKSLEHRNFRLYFWGQLLSMVGTWMQIMAQTWLVYRLTKSGSLLGLVSFASQAPAIVLGLIGGSAADHFDRRKLMLWTQSAALVQAAALGVLTMTGTIQVWHIVVLSALLGVITAFDMPARQAIIVHLVPREDLGNAIALNTITINASRLVGPAAAGLLVAACGEGPVFLMNAASYVFSIATLAVLTLAPFREKALPSPREAWAHIAEGVRYAWSDDERRRMLSLLAVLSFFGVPFMALLPMFADRLNVAAAGTGWLMGVSGAGAVAGSAMLALRSGENLTGVIGKAAAVFGLGLVAFCATPWLGPALLAMAFAGWGMMSAFVGCNMMLQSRTSDEMRGRLMSLFSLTFLGLTPIGSLLGGWCADRVGAPLTLGVGGAACAAAAAVYWQRHFRALGDVQPI